MLLRCCLAFLLIGWCSMQAAPAPSGTPGRSVPPFTAPLRPGDFVWRPELSPSGPVVVLIQLSDQTAYVFRNGVRIARSTVSTGTPGHRTPVGVFTVLEKQVHHVSTIYRGAKMPYMQRLTWRGVALHAGYLPGRPASHGCVRMPYEFARRLYGITGVGTTVIVAGGRMRPNLRLRPGLLWEPGMLRTGAIPADAPGYEWHPERAPIGPVSIVVSLADRRVHVLRRGAEIGRAVMTPLRPGVRLGTRVYTALAQLDSEGRREWAVTAEIGRGGSGNLRELVRELSVPVEFQQLVRSVVTPGATLILTDRPVGLRAEAESGDILSSDGPRTRRSPR